MPSLKSLRKLKKQMFPDVVRKEDEALKLRGQEAFLAQQAKDQERADFMSQGFSLK